MSKIYETELGQYGKVSVEMKEGGILSIDLNAHADLIEELRKLVKKTSTLLDDRLIEMIGSVIGKKSETVAKAEPTGAAAMSEGEQILPQAEQA